MIVGLSRTTVQNLQNLVSSDKVSNGRSQSPAALYNSIKGKSGDVIGSQCQQIILYIMAAIHQEKA